MANDQRSSMHLSEENVPIHEYRCPECHRRVSILWRSFSEAEKGEPTCPHCGSDNLTRLVSRVRVVRSEESRLDDLSGLDDMPDIDENDPRSLGRWMRRMSDEVGEDLGPEFDEVVGRLEAGESPEDVEQSMPELLGEAGGFEDDMDF
jgi:putative FmdB family regulatory protein